MPQPQYSPDIEALTGTSDTAQSDGVTNTPDGQNGTIAPQLGWLRALAGAMLAKRNNRSWHEDEQQMRERIVRWRVNRLRRKGVVGVFAVKTDKDRNSWEVHIPTAARRVPPTMNKAARLARRLKANLFADPPTPEGVPNSEQDEDRSAAEFAARMLIELGGPAGYNDLRSARRAFDLAATYDSAFRHFRVNPTGGGCEPKTIEASKAATTVENAIKIMVPAPGSFDANGQPVPAPVGPNGLPQMIEQLQPLPYITRYVGQDGVTIVDDPAQAAVEWAPSIEVDVLTGRHVRARPVGCQDMNDAKMVHIAALLRVKELKARCPKAGIDSWDENRIREMAKWRPENHVELLPTAQRDQPNAEVLSSSTSEDKGAMADKDKLDSLLVFVLTSYAVQQPDYPTGAYVITAGETEVLCQEDWCAEIKGVKEKLDIPLDHFKGFEEGEDDFYGYHLMHLLGPGNELRATVLGSFIEYLDRFNRRKTFYPWNAPFSPKDMNGPMGDYLPYNPQIGAIQHEQVPEYPRSGVELLNTLGTEIDDEAGLPATAQGETSPEVQSGLHAQTILDTVATGLSDIKQGTQDAIERGWRIVMQLVREYWTVPQRNAFLGTDNRYKMKEWTGADLIGTRAMRVMKGSFTMLSPSGKMAIAEHANGLGLLTPQELKHVALGNTGGLLGMQDDPHWQRIKQQISDYLDGPPPGTPPQMIANLAAAIWMPRVTDVEPAVAQTRLYEIGRMISGTKYAKLDPVWQQFAVMEYVRMQTALVPPAPMPGPGGGEGAGGTGLGGKEPLPNLAQGTPDALAAA